MTFSTACLDNCIYHRFATSWLANQSRTLISQYTLKPIIFLMSVTIFNSSALINYILVQYLWLWTLMPVRYELWLHLSIATSWFAHPSSLWTGDDRPYFSTAWRKSWKHRLMMHQDTTKQLNPFIPSQTTVFHLGKYHPLWLFLETRLHFSNHTSESHNYSFCSATTALDNWSKTSSVLWFSR